LAEHPINIFWLLIRLAIAAVLHPNLTESNLMSKTLKVSPVVVLLVASIALTLGFAGCKKSDNQEQQAVSQPAQADQSQDQSQNGANTDNLAPTNGNQAPAYQGSQQPAAQQPAPAPQQQQQAAPAPEQQQAAPEQAEQPNSDQQAAASDETESQDASQCFRRSNLLRLCRSIRSPLVQAKATCGPQVTGVMLLVGTTGCLVRGRSRLQ
jgi:type IV secretory pathway VirB10-like protein